MNKIFLHVDLDAFFASVEQLDHPEYRGKPVIVGGLPQDRRSVVSTASYEARQYGVHSAMPTSQALRLCPNGIFVRCRMERYHEKSEEVMNIFREYSPDIQQISVDEAFIDLTGTEKLFGPPEETARRLKAEVFEKTGLTVSVGLASTKYCAKIASGLKKPDGLTIVEAGRENEFMLSLPIEKVWGAGSKTLEKLKNYGIKTTRDIYNRSESLLKSLFGNATGSFLYNAVRGNEGHDFRADPKTRSISAETTYDYDLTNPDIIETAMLNLCHTVMFRSLKEKVRSSTVFLKIRYEDFSTVSVQATSERYVSSIDDLFERAKALLRKKRDASLGIRLLGIGLQNLEDESKPRQKELFDFGEEKKRKLEEAILKAQEKDPSLKITKARLLGTVCLLLSFLSFPQAKLEAETKVSEKEADGAGGIVFDTSKLPLSDSGRYVPLFDSAFKNQEVEFFAEGYWKSTITGSASYSFGFGTVPTLSVNSPVFAQNIDLSLFFMLNDHWYFEAAFADEFNKNTIAAGFKGKNVLKEVRISNRNIIFPSIYSIEEIKRGIGGNDNQAPGFSINWKGEKWRADAAFRYDMLEAHEKTWYGSNSVSTDEIPLSSWNTGSRYFLPKKSLIQNIKAIYVETSSGIYTDSRGRKYKKLDETQFLLDSSQFQLILSKDAKAYRHDGKLPAVAVTFWTEVKQSDFGNYDEENSFLWKVKEWFNRDKDRRVKLEQYSYSLFNSINGEDCLFLQHPSGFSPFTIAKTYDLGTSKAGEAQVAFSSSGISDPDFNAVIGDDDYRLVEKDFFYSSHLYADIYLAEDNSEDELDALIHSAFPLAAKVPEAYLGLSVSKITDEVLQIRSFTPVARLEIGTEAVSGTVTVYRNGVIDSSAEYDSESGTITLSSTPSPSDHITASWYEESSDSQSGSFAGAMGYRYNFTDRISGDLSSSVRWSYSPDTEYADSSSALKGFAALAGKVSYTGDFFSISNTAALTFDNPNTTGKYRIIGNDDCNSETYYLTKTSAVNLPEDFAPTLNVRTSGSREHTALSLERKGSLPKSQGKTDSSISGYAQSLEWDFSKIEAGSGEKQVWSALTLYTPAISSSLLNAEQFSIAVKNDLYKDIFDTSGCALYLQLGVSADEDFTVEETELIPTWKISDPTSDNIKSVFDFSKSGWQIIKVALTEEDRFAISCLQNYNVRIILTASRKDSLPEKGSIYFGPYQCSELSFSSSVSSNIITTNYQTQDSTLTAEKIKSFNKDHSLSKNKVQLFEWDFFDKTELKDSGEEISFTRYFSGIDLADYKKLSFYLKAENTESVTITLSRSAGKDSSENALTYTIEKPYSLWTEYEIDLRENISTKNIFVNTKVIPTKLEITVNTKEKGSLSFDELYLSENITFSSVQDKITSSFKKEGRVWGAKDFDILKDFSASVTGKTASSMKSESKKTKTSTLESESNMSFTLTNLKIKANASFSNACKNAKSSDINQKNLLKGAGHSLESDNPFFNAISFYESYSFSSDEASLEKTSGAKVNLSNYHIPLSLSAESRARSDLWALSQDVKTDAVMAAGRFTLTGEARAYQQLVTGSASENADKRIETDSYLSSYMKITDFSFDTGEQKASKRSVKAFTAASWQFDSLKFKPEIAFNTEGNYKALSKTTFTDISETELKLPFSVSKNSFLLSWQKTGGSTEQAVTGGNYEADVNKLQKAFSEKSYYIKALPVCDLLSSDLACQVLESRREINYYTGNYSFSWKRAFFADRYDFFIPQTAKLEFSRDIRTGTSSSDLYQIKNSASYMAMNIFGTSGTLPLFSFFSSDEYNSSLSASIKLPRNNPSAYICRFDGYIQSTLYFQPQNYLKNAFELSLENSRSNENYWKTRYTLIWKRDADSSLAKGIVSVFKSENSLKKNRIIKTDSLNTSVSDFYSNTKKIRKYSAAFSHETETYISKYISINTDFGISYEAVWEKSAILTARASIGGSIKF